MVHFLPAEKGGDAMGKKKKSGLYLQRLKEIKEMNLTSDLFSSVVFEDIKAVEVKVYSKFD